MLHDRQGQRLRRPVETCLSSMCLWRCIEGVACFAVIGTAAIAAVGFTDVASVVIRLVGAVAYVLSRGRSLLKLRGPAATNSPKLMMLSKTRARPSHQSR